MKAMFAVATALLALVVFPAVARQSGDEHPVEKVIVLLKGLITQVEDEGKAEAVSYTKFEYWCKNSAATLTKAIAEEKAAIDTLESKIDSKTKEIATLDEQIGALETQLGKLDAANSAANKVRTDTNDAYKLAETDYTDTIDAIKSALEALEAAGTSTEAGLVEVKKALALVQASSLEDPTVKAAGDMEAHVDKYNFKSGNVIELLKSLLAKFEDDKLDSTKAETNSLNAHALSTDARDNAKTAAEDSKKQKEDERGEADADLIAAKASLQDEESDLEADTVSLTETDKSCTRRKGEWAERSEIRTQELAAMNAAIKILAKATGVRTEAPSNPVPPPSPVGSEEAPAFLQVVDPKMKAVNLLRARARSTHSKQLERLAQEVEAHLSGPFDEVNNMIEKMVFRLMAEQKDEDDHKNWCDKELAKTNASKTNKEDKIEELDAKLDDAKATVQKMTDEITAANEMVSKITGFKKEATDVRTSGKQENAEAIKDAAAGQKALANAVAVLEAFYKDSGMIDKAAWELLQDPAPVELPDEPALWDSGYTGATDPKSQPGGIIAVLKKTSAEFAKMEADTKAQEAMDQNQYQEDMKDNDIEMARRSKESEIKSQEKKRLIDKIDKITKQRKHNSDELEAVDQYLEDLKPACVDGDSTYEDRKAARDQEISGLKDAQGILKDAFKEKESSSAPDPEVSLRQRKFLRRSVI